MVHSDDEIDEEEDDGPTGNEGVTVRHWYHRACLVIWPRSFAVKIALSAGVESAVNLGRRCLQDFYRPRYFILENVRNFVSRRRRWWVHDRAVPGRVVIGWSENVQFWGRRLSIQTDSFESN